MPITQRASVDSGMQLSRVSLAYRNPENAPNDWQTSVLEDFEEQKMAGAGFDSLEWSETIDTEYERVFRFMKAIPTGGVCLACHGENISPEVQQQLSALYPEDRATGAGTAPASRAASLERDFARSVPITRCVC